MVNFSVWCLCLVLLTIAAPCQDYFEQGNAKAAARNYKGALADFQEGLKAQPNTPELLYNAGMAAYACEEFQLAADLWKRYRALEPEKYHGYTKSIQAEQALGNIDRVNELITELRERWKAGKVPELASDPFFCRYQFDFQDHHFYVMQCIEPNPEKRDHFWDLVMRKKDTDEYEGFFYVMLDPAASAYVRASTGKESEAWFLDYRNRVGRRPITSFDYQPDLQETVALIKQYLSGDQTPRYKNKAGTSD